MMFMIFAHNRLTLEASLLNPGQKTAYPLNTGCIFLQYSVLQDSDSAALYVEIALFLCDEVRQ